MHRVHICSHDFLRLLAICIIRAPWDLAGDLATVQRARALGPWDREIARDFTVILKNVSRHRSDNLDEV
jgi:hypothetical protein